MERKDTNTAETPHTHTCKRCKRTLDTQVGDGWGTLATDSSLSSLLATLPDHAELEAGAAKPSQISQLLSQQFRADSRHIETGGKGSESFVLLSTSQESRTSNERHHQQQQQMSGDAMRTTLDAIGRIMDKVDARSALEHPMCAGCAEAMLRVLDREASDAEHEQRVLVQVGEIMLRASDEETSELSELQSMEDALKQTLGQLDSQLDDIEVEIAALARESTDLAAAEEAAHGEHNERQAQLDEVQRGLWESDARYARLSTQLTQLQRTNVYNDIFNIAVVEGVGSINGFRLGGRTTRGVSWEEINAAWGQALLLLQTVARRLAYEFTEYRLIPMGSFSRIEKVGGGVLELFGSAGDDMYLGRLFQSRRLDSAMVVFLACLDEIAQLIVSINPELRIPYKITADRVGGYSIKIQGGQDEAWTRACKNMLVNARWALAFASSYSPPAQQ